MTEQRPAVRRTWRAHLPVEFGHFVLFDNAEDHSYTGGFRTDSGNLLLAASTGSPADITVDLPAPGDYRLSARRLPDLVDTSLGDRARCEQWILRIWPAPSS